jgi:hypothetical protein
MTQSGKAWTVRDRYRDEVYLTWERWYDHILLYHSEMTEFFEELRDTIGLGRRWQDPLNPQRYRYIRWFDSLALHEYNCIVAIVIIKPATDERFIVTAYQDYRVEKR